MNFISNFHGFSVDHNHKSGIGEALPVEVPATEDTQC